MRIDEISYFLSIGKSEFNSVCGFAFYIFFTYQFVCLTWIFFRSSSASAALDILKRIGSLTFSMQNVSLGVLLVSLAAGAGQALPKSWYEFGVSRFARSPFYVQAAAIALAVVAIQMWAGQTVAPFVYTRF